VSSLKIEGRLKSPEYVATSRGLSPGLGQIIDDRVARTRRRESRYDLKWRFPAGCTRGGLAASTISNWSTRALARSARAARHVQRVEGGKVFATRQRRSRLVMELYLTPGAG